MKGVVKSIKHFKIISLIIILFLLAACDNGSNFCNHDWDWAVIMFPTKTTDGEKIETCKRCGETRGYRLLFAAGNGTADDPFLITNEVSLRRIGTGMNGWELSSYYKLTMNINLTDTWTPIYQFTGDFNGNNKTISGLTGNGGMFGSIELNGRVRNLILVDVYIVGRFAGIGGVANFNNGIIINCSVSGTINGGFVGGIVGFNFGMVSNSTATGMVTGSGSVGGIAGWNSTHDGMGQWRNSIATVQNSYFSGNVGGSGSLVSVGGVVGFNQQGTVQNSFSVGNVSGTGTLGTLCPFGGIVGRHDSGTIRNNVALNHSIIVSDGVSGRVVGWGLEGLANNYAWTNMSVSHFFSPNINGVDGACVSTMDAIDKFWWMNDSNLGWAWGNCESFPWIWDDNAKQPRLWFE